MHYMMENEHQHSHHEIQGNERRVFWTLILTGSFMIVEAIGGIISGSLALLADAGHMLTDTASLALAWFAFRLSHKPADVHRSFGYHRFQVLAAFINGMTLLAIVGWILFEAVQRLLNPIQIKGEMMLSIAIIGLFVNILALIILRGGEQENLNIRGAILHVLGDLLGSAAAISAAGVILITGWMPIDPILSFLVAALILRSAWLLVRQSSHILLEGTPEGLDVYQLRDTLIQSFPHIDDVHHIHVWSLTQEKPLLTMHVRVNEDISNGEILSDIKNYLDREYGIEHTTIQIEGSTCIDKKH